MTDPQDLEGNKQPADMGLPTTTPDEGISKTRPLPEGTNINSKDSKRITQLVDIGHTEALVTDQSWTGIEDHVDKTQSTRFEMSGPDQNKPCWGILMMNSKMKVMMKYLRLEKKWMKTSKSLAKHEEAVASYAYLRAAAEEYADNRAQTNAAMNKTMDHIDIINKERVGKRTSLLKTLNKVFETLEADSALKEAMQNKLEVKDVEKEPKHAPQETQPIPITIVRPITNPALEVEMIGSSSRLQLTYTILEVQIPQPKKSTKVHRDPDAPVLVPYEIHGKLYHLTEEQIQAHLDKEEKMEQAAKEARLSKHELIKVVHEEATKDGVNPKALSRKKGGHEFLKIQDDKMNVLKRERLEKFTKAKELRKKIIDQYRWTTTRRIDDIK
ncbi:hypothetical protein Tco_1209084 [Tanacetum coccineum]